MKLNILRKYSPPCQKSGSYLATISTANEGHNWEWILLRNHLKCLTSTFSSSRSRNLRRHSPLHSLFFSCSDREWKQSEQTEKQMFSLLCNPFTGKISTEMCLKVFWQIGEEELEWVTLSRLMMKFGVLPHSLAPILNMEIEKLNYWQLWSLYFQKG